MPPRKTLLLVSTGVLAALLGGAWYHSSHTFRAKPVIDSSVYRSAQPAPGDLRDVAEELGVRTVLNLRGAHPGKEWFEDERREADESGIELLSFPFETFDWPPRIETLELVSALDSSERPILVHCWSGRDRSSWAAGVALLLQGDSLEHARDQLSILNLHICGRGFCPLHAFFDAYESWLAQEGAAHSPAAFRRWVNEDYYPEPYRTSLTAADGASAVVSDGRFGMDVTFANSSKAVWMAGGENPNPMLPGARVLGPFDEVPSDILSRFRVARSSARDAWRLQWSGEWPPGELRPVRVEFEAPSDPGIWVAQIDMVHEGAHWFSDLGGPGLIVPFRIDSATQAN